VNDIVTSVPPRPAVGRADFTRWLVPASYGLLTIVFWGTYVFSRGLHADTVYIELSQTRSWSQGFIYPFDSTRMFMSVPFHLGYLISNGGAYLGAHLVFGALVWLTGLLTYLLVRSFLPQAVLFSFAAGAIALVHGADDFANLLSINMVRQSVVCVLLAVVLLRVSWQKRMPLLFVPIACAQALSLWSYEAGLAVLLCAPLLVVSRGMSVRRFAAWTLAWSIVPLFSVTSILYRYAFLGQVSYQSQELASSVSVRETAARLWALSSQGVAFWAWPARWLPMQIGCADLNLRRFAFPMTIGALAFVACAAVIGRSEWKGWRRMPWALVFLASGAFLALSYGPYLVLHADRYAPTWRTQFFAAAPAAILIAAFAFGLDALLRARSVIAVAVSAAAVTAGLYAGLASQLEQTRRWQPYRSVMAAIVNAAPRIKDDTFIAVVGTPPAFFHTLCENSAVPNPPFEDEIWFDSGLHVLYPDTRVVGMFWRDDLLAPGSMQFTFDEKGARLLKTSMAVKGTSFGYDQMIAFAYDQTKGAVLLPTFPSMRIPGAAQTAAYDPAARILPGPPPTSTVRKLER
jgi:hypothetical protein